MFGSWACQLIGAPVPAVDGPFYAYVEFLDDTDFLNLNKEELLAPVPHGYKHTFFFVVDGVAMSHPDFPILVVDLDSDRGRSFRAVPVQIQSIENNLSIANMRFQEFADSVDHDGIFRGFPTP
ncbi:MAG: hypothetical protein ABSG13_16095 [Bryobacteraceae bacterium]|jgi:hypothetical protein